MRLLEFLKLITQPDLDVKVYTIDHYLIAHGTLVKIIQILETNRNEDKYELGYNAYILIYANIKYLSFEYNDTLCVTLEDNLRG